MKNQTRCKDKNRISIEDYLAIRHPPTCRGDGEVQFKSTSLTVAISRNVYLISHMNYTSAAEKKVFPKIMSPS